MELIKFTEDNDSLEKDAILAIAKAKKENITILKEKNTKKSDRNLKLIVDSFFRAARALRIPKNSQSTQKGHIASMRMFYLANALKHRAIITIKEDADNAESFQDGLKKATSFYKKSVDYIDKANWEYDEKYQYITYVHHHRFSYNILNIRHQLQQYMAGVEEKTISTAINSFENARKAAIQLKDKFNIDIFPNYYNSIEDFSNEHDFILTVQAFKKRDWSKCLFLLEKILNNFPRPFHGTWRHSNLSIRLNCIQLLKLLGNKTQNKADIKKIISEIKSQQFKKLGNATHAFVDQIILLASTRFDEKNLNNLDALFLLDTVTYNYTVEINEQYFKILPKVISDGFTVSETEISGTLNIKKIELEFSIKTYFKYILDYNQQWDAMYHSESFENLDIKNLSIEQCLEEMKKITFFRDEKFSKKLIDIVNTIKSKLNNILFIENHEDFKIEHKHIISLVRNFEFAQPLVVEVGKEKLVRGSDEYFIGIPDNCVQEFPLSEILIQFEREESRQFEPNCYYLQPQWKKGTLSNYFVNSIDNRPLFPVRFDVKADLNTVVSLVKKTDDYKVYSRVKDLIEKNENFKSEMNSSYSILALLMTFLDEYKYVLENLTTFRNKEKVLEVEVMDNLLPPIHLAFANHLGLFVTREEQIARGRPDIVVRRNLYEGCVIELKMGNSYNKHNAGNQVKVYKSGLRMDHSIDCVICTKEGQANQLEGKFSNRVSDTHKIIFLDLYKLTSASKVRDEK